MPKQKLNVYAEHRVIARFDEVSFYTCQAKTGACPERCGASGNFARFMVLDYLHYEKKHQYGDDKQEKYSIQLTDFFRNGVGDPQLKEYVKTFKPGDLVVIEWKHLYGEVTPRSWDSLRPLLKLRKIDEAEAKVLREQAEIAS